MKEVKGILNICRKAGYLIIGGDNIKTYHHKMFLIVVDKSAGKSLMREMTLISKENDIELLCIEALGELIGIDNCKAVAVRNKALSDEIIQIIKGEKLG